MILVLASASPRRKELLEQIGAKPWIEVSDIEEVSEYSDPVSIAQDLAYKKVMDIRKNVKEDIALIGADTIVSVSGMILGKPKTEDDAEIYLELLQGREHSVYTGVCLLVRFEGEEEIINFVEETKVQVAPMSKQQILDYIATKEPMDKAGAYGIQGIFAKHIVEIRGDYNNVVGLPVGRIYREFLKQGIDICSIS